MIESVIRYESYVFIDVWIDKLLFSEGVIIIVVDSAFLVNKTAKRYKKIQNKEDFWSFCFISMAVLQDQMNFIKNKINISGNNVLFNLI